MRRTVIGAAALGVLAMTAGAVVWSATGLAAQARSPGPASFDALLGLLAAGCAAACSGWLAVGAVLTVVGSLPGAFARIVDDIAQVIAPRVWRRAIQLALGAALVAGPFSGASAWADASMPASMVAAAKLDPRAGLPGIERPAPDPAALPPIDRPTDSSKTTWVPTAPPKPAPVTPPASPLLTGNPRPTATIEEAIVVRRGDSLWHIAARHLGSSVSAAEIATEWPRWWNANRDVIGDNPDLILPGQVLRPPA
jgi:resuscitation-promoting factor RpfA